MCEGNSVVVATHLMHCTACRRAVRNLDTLAGGLLEDAETAAISSAGRSACLARLDGEDTSAVPVERLSESRSLPSAGTTQRVAEVTAEPHALYPHGGWKWLGPGIQVQAVDVPSESGTRVFLLKAAPGKRLPDHKHIGTEWTCVLQGAFRHDGGRFGPGDFDEADSEFDHNPEVEDGVECICLVAMNGEIRMKSWIGRLIQPLVKL